MSDGLPGLSFMRALRKRKQKELAKAVGVSQNHLSGVEAGTREASLPLAKALAKELDCTLDRLANEPTDELLTEPAYSGGDGGGTVVGK